MVRVCLLGRGAVGFEVVAGNGNGLRAAGVHPGTAAFDRSPIALGGLHRLDGTSPGIGIFVAGSFVMPEVEDLRAGVGDAAADQVHGDSALAHDVDEVVALLWEQVESRGDGLGGGRESNTEEASDFGGPCLAPRIAAFPAALGRYGPGICPSESDSAPSTSKWRRAEHGQGPPHVYYSYWIWQKPSDLLDSASWASAW